MRRPSAVPLARRPIPPDRAMSGFLTRGHPAASAAIAAMIAGSPPHALSIAGPPGVGKTTLALDLAAGLLCDVPDPAARPCRACRGCRLVDSGGHARPPPPPPRGGRAPNPAGGRAQPPAAAHPPPL